MKTLNPEINMGSALTVLKFTMIALIGIAVVSFVLILWQAPREFDFSGPGFAAALELYRFPLTCFAAAIALLTVLMTIATLRQSTIQNAVATWSLIQSNFNEHARKVTNLPIAVLCGEETLSKVRWSSANADESLFSVVYASPNTTLRRLYDTKNLTVALTSSFTEELEPPPHPKLIEALFQIERHYNDMRENMVKGDAKWLSHLIDLAVVTRQLREYLALTTNIIRSWDKVPKLESDKLGKSYLPPYSSVSLVSVTGGVRVEMICIVHALHFSRRLEKEASRLFHMAINVGRIWSATPPELQDHLEMDIGLLWRNTQMIAGHSISIPPVPT